MAVMTSQPQLVGKLDFETKAQPVPSSDVMDLNENINGGTTQPAPLDESLDDSTSVPHTNGDGLQPDLQTEPEITEAPAAAAELNGSTDAPDAVEDATLSSAPVNAGAPSSAIPPANSAESIEPTAALASSLEPPLSTSPAPAPAQAPSPPSAPVPATTENMDTEVDDKPETTAQQSLFGAPDQEAMETVPAPAVEMPEAAPAVAEGIDSIAASENPVNNEGSGAEAAAPPTGTLAPGESAADGTTVDEDQEMVDAPDAPIAGKVRSREDDEEEGDRSAKRAKTEEEVGKEDVASSLTQEPEAPVSETTETQPPPLSGPPAVLNLPEILGIKEIDPEPLTQRKRQYLVDLVRKAKKTKDAPPFGKPVDAKFLNLPTYHDIVKKPMDLSTLETNLKENKYATGNEFLTDFNLIVQNATLFNGSEHPVTRSGMNLKAYVDKNIQQLPHIKEIEVKKPKKATPQPKNETTRRASKAAAAAQVQPPSASSPQNTFALQPDGMPMIRRDSSALDGRPKREIHRPPPKDLPYTQKPKRKKYALELRFCEHVLDVLFQRKHQSYAYPFLTPVDPVALNIPNYLKVIKKPMDLGTVKTNLKQGEYTNAKEFYTDVKLIFENCFKFNPPTDEVYKMGKQLQEVFEGLWASKDEWMVQHRPQSDPTSSVTGDSDEESDQDDEPEEDVSAKMAALQQQLAAISGQMAELTGAKATAKKPSPKVPGKKGAKAAKPSKSKRGSTALPTTKPKKAKAVPSMSNDQKRIISDQISNLSETEMMKAVQIIRNGCPHLKDVKDDEMELEIDEIPLPTLWELWKSVVPEHLKKPAKRESPDSDDDVYQPASRAAAKANTSKHRKSKPMSASEQERKIAEIKSQLASFEHDADDAAPGPQLPAAQTYESSGDEEESDSESEEE